MKKLKTVLQCRFIYLFLLFFALVSYVVSDRVEHVSVYDDFVNEEFVITNISVKSYGVKLDLKGKEKVIGYLYYDEEKINSFVSSYELGDLVLLSGLKSDVSNNTLPDTFNYKKYLKSNEIYNVIEITNISKVSDNKNIFYSVKNKLLERGKSLSKSYPYVSSLIFGNNGYLDEDVLASYRENGISHLFAISGLHISIFILLISWVLDRLKFPILIKSFILSGFLLFYMFLTNFSMSVIRGAIFTILLIFNKLLKFEISSGNLLIFAFVIIMFNNPLNINNVGLQYSFLVTLFLIINSSIIKGGKVKTLFMVSLVAFLVSYPITVNNFNQVNFLSVIYNIFYVPYVSSILLPFTLISYVFPFLDEVLYFFIKIIESTSQFLNSLSFLKVSMCKMNVLMIVSYFVLICKLFSKWNVNKWRYLFLVFLFFIMHFLMPFKTDDYVMFVDVRQGDSAIISVNGKITLIDTGGVLTYGDEEYSYKLSKNKFLPFFKANGIRKIDNLVLTHGDADHMREAYYLIDKFPVSNVFVNSNDFNELELEVKELCDIKGIYFSSLSRGDKLDVGGFTLESLNGDMGEENDSSIVLYGLINNKSFLFMGDASIGSERYILENNDLDDVDVLKVGHHGSKTSSSEAFIDEINPKYSVISVGENNRYGHPDDEVLFNLRNSNIYRTDMDGSIMFEFEKNKLNINTWSP